MKQTMIVPHVMEVKEEGGDHFIYLGFNKDLATADQVDALVSMLGKKLLISHDERTIKTIEVLQ